MAKNNKLEKKVTPIIHYLVSGLQKKLHERFELKSEPAVVMTNFPLQYFLTTGGGFRLDNPDVKYPYTYIRPQTIGKDPESYPASLNAKSRFAARTAIGNQEISSFNMVPVILSFEFGYIGDDPMKFLEFCAEWIFAAESGEMNYAVKYLGVKIDVRVKLEDNWAIPEKEDSTEPQSQVLAVSTINIYSVVTGKEEVVAIQESQVRPAVSVGLLTK